MMSVIINNKEYPILKYLPEEQAVNLKFHFPTMWHKRKDFGLRYEYRYLGVFIVSERGKLSKVFVCRNKKGIWLSLLYGHNQHLETVESIANAGLWFSNPKKWNKIISNVSL
ncbi:MAG: hypothetical protein ACYCS1_05180 [Gammaproteobacteria bacterium]